MNNAAVASTAQTKKTSGDEKMKAKEAIAAQKTSSSSVERGGVGLCSLPRVSSSLTKAQLTAELLFRHPTQKCLSNKSKGDLIVALGNGSISMTSPECQSLDFTNVRIVTAAMTRPQLTAEAIARDPAISGLSNWSKDSFLKHLGVGSVWMSSRRIPDGSSSLLATEKPSIAASPVPELKLVACSQFYVNH